tara:strand:- start:8588 stop:9511 length:924 start_codon:yes stop_codon:yes gene_type:complete
MIDGRKDLLNSKKCISILLIITMLFLSCDDFQSEQSLTKEQIQHVHQFVGELNRSLEKFEFDFIKKVWSHTLFKRKIGKLDNIGHDVFNHVYETTVKGVVTNLNLNLINKVKHSGATLKHIKTNIMDTYAEVTYLLIEEGYYHFTKYRIDLYNGKPYLSDIYSFKDNQWFSSSMREIVLLNTKYTAFSTNRHEANKALEAYQHAINNSDYEYAFAALNQIPESHQITNEFKIAKINTAALINDSLLLKTIDEENNLEEGNSIYIDYLISFYLMDSILKEEVNARIQKEIGISKFLLDSLNTQNLVWN